MMSAAIPVLAGHAEGPVIATSEPLSFWGGVDPATGIVIDTHHPLHGRCLSGAVLVMPTTRGSCTGSGVLLDMALSEKAPAALVFSQPEDVVTLGAMIAAEMFGISLPVLRLSPRDATALAAQSHAQIASGPDGGSVRAGAMSLRLAAPGARGVTLEPRDQALLDGQRGKAAQLAMRIIVAMAANQGAGSLLDVSRAHIDGCIYASPANLTFAEKMADLGAKVRVPTTMNAISVDHRNWQSQGVPRVFGGPAQRLADAYLRMGCQPTFTCAPYLLPGAPECGDRIAWAESNAVVYANSVLGARTAKHPDFLDLCIAITGRAPLAGVYLDKARAARRIIDIELPEGADDLVWPLIGYLAGRASPDRIPLLRGLAGARPGGEALKAICAAFGTTSAAPMLHVEGITPEADQIAPDADHIRLTRADLAEGWHILNDGPAAVDLVAIGSPHASLDECRALAQHLGARKAALPVIVTAGRQVIDAARAEGTLARLQDAGVQVLPDLCWCSISEPVFPPATRALITNSGKYAHYGPGLTGRALRFASLADCAKAAISGKAPEGPPDWLGDIEAR